jgi:plastocyanin domain-containing protein
MGIVMFFNGWNLTAPSKKFLPEAKGDAFIGVTKNDLQVVKSTLLPNRYPAITVKQGIPVRWIINAPPGSITGCNNRMIIREYGIQYTFKPGENIIEFTPAKVGIFRYSCWMAMIHSTITVLAGG